MPGTHKRAFTLIELLVAMSILAVIVLSVSQLFEQSTVAWDRGWQRSELMMTGRAILDFVAGEASLALYDPVAGWIPLSGPNPSWRILEGTNLPQQVAYSWTGGGITRNGTPLVEQAEDEFGSVVSSISGFEVTFNFDPGPISADVEVEVTTSDKGQSETKKFTKRVLLINRNRYRYD